MTTKSSRRYCADPQAIAAMKRDGIGWGHDLACGQLELGLIKQGPGPMARMINTLKRNVR